MALIEKFVVIADHYAVASGQTIIEGQWVELNSSGEIIIANGSAAEVALGVAADTKSTSTSGLPSTNNAFIGASAVSSAFVNRVSDTFDETKASGKMTVYHSGGVFASDRYNGSIAVNDDLYVDTDGDLTATPSTSAQIVAYCVKAPGAYPSGVPGIDVNGDLTLGNYLEFKMVV